MDLYRINKDEGGRLSSSHIGIRNIPSHVCYDDTKHYQVKSEHRRIQNPFKHLRRHVFALTVNGLNWLTHYAKTLHLRCLKRFEEASAEKQGAQV